MIEIAFWITVGIWGFYNLVAFAWLVCQLCTVGDYEFDLYIFPELNAWCERGGIWGKILIFSIFGLMFAPAIVAWYICVLLPLHLYLLIILCYVANRKHK